MNEVLEFLQEKADICAISTIRGYITAIADRHKRVRLKGKYITLSQLPSVKTWLAGLERKKGFRKPRAPEWNLEIVIAALGKHPFEPLNEISLKHLTMKTAFLVAITSAKRVSEMHALDEHSIRYQGTRVTVDTLPWHRHKVDTPFHANCPIAFPMHELGKDDLPQELCVGRALREYCKRTRHYRVNRRKPNALFLCHGMKDRKKAASKQTIARWLQDTITLAYELMEVPVEDRPHRVHAHSTRKLSTSTAFEQGVDVETICQAATWSTPKTFFQFYRLDVDRREDTLFGLSVLQSSVKNVQKRFNMMHPKPLPSSHRPKQAKFVPPWELPSTSRAQATPSTSQAPSRLRNSTLPLSFHPPSCRCKPCLERRKK